MEFAEVVRRRRMVRRYAADPVAPDVVDTMLAHAVRAPSAGFTQGTSFLRLDDPAAVGAFWTATTRSPVEGEPDSAWLRGMRTAPVVLVVWADEAAYRERYAEPDKAGSDQSWDVPYWHVDAGMAALLILQTCVDVGLGACFFGVPAASWPRLRETFGVPEALVPTGAITVGHPEPGAARGGSAARRPRRAHDDVVHRGRWGS